jgi:PAS domain S-box-containing protein
MSDPHSTPEPLLNELRALRQRVAYLEAAARATPAGGEAPSLPAWVSQTLNTLDDDFFILDGDFRFRYVNAAALRHAGRLLADLLGRSVWEAYPMLVGTPVEIFYRRALADQVAVHFEIPGLLTGRWLEVHAYPSPDALVVYARDTSERRKAEQALRESETRFRQMAETIDEVFWLNEADGARLLYVSPAYEAIWGRTCQSLHERPSSWLEAIHPDDRERVTALFGRRLQGDSCHVEYRVVRPDGSVRWVLDSAFPVRDAAGRICRHAGVAKDITDRKRAEGRLRRFFEAAFEGLVLHADGIILDVNRAAADLFGCPPAALVGRAVLDFAVPEGHAEIRRRIREGAEDRYEAVAFRADGSTFPIELCGKNIDYQGRAARVTALRDITERKKAELALRESAQRLEALSRRLLAVQEEERRRLARELHDEVAQVLVGLDYRLEWGRRAQGEQRDAALAAAQGLVRDLARQVRDASLLLRPSLLDDLGLGPALAWHCQRYTEQTGVQVALEPEGLAGRLPAAVETAAYRVVQEALTNVARHARVGQAVVRVRAEPGRLLLAVEDRGTGFDPATVRAAAPGAGLSGMRERVALLGGSLSVVSAPGAGTRLRVELPVRDEEDKGHGDGERPAGG